MKSITQKTSRKKSKPMIERSYTENNALTIYEASVKPFSAHSTIRFFDEADRDNTSQLMANKFRSTSILNEYNQKVKGVPITKSGKTLLQLRKQEKTAMNIYEASRAFILDDLHSNRYFDTFNNCM